MGTSLTGQTQSSTYDALLKVTDNGPVGGTLKTITDGLGNDSALQLSTAGVKSTGTLAADGAVTFGSTLSVTGLVTLNTVTSIGATTPGTGAFTTLSANGLVTLSSSNIRPLRLTGATTGGSVIDVGTTGGSTFLGMESSTGGLFIIGSSAYDTVIRGVSGVAFSVDAGASMQMRLSSTGLALTGALTLSTDLAVTEGGTGASNASGARTNLGLVIGTNVAPATSGTSILYGNGSGGFSNVTVGSGLSFAGGTLSATGSGGTVTSVGIAGNNGIGVSGSPITGSGTITLSLSAITPTTVTASSFIQGTEYRVSGTKVVGAQSAAEADIALSTSISGSDTVDAATIAANFGTLNGKINSILAKIRTHGLFAT